MTTANHAHITPGRLARRARVWTSSDIIASAFLIAVAALVVVPLANLVRIALAEDTVKLLEPAYRTGVSRIPHVPSLAYRIAMIADGRIDGTVVKKNSHDWDLAAADLILERAGGALFNLNGQPLSYNRPNVTHTVLCAAAIPALPALIAAAQGLEGH